MFDVLLRVSEALYDGVRVLAEAGGRAPDLVGAGGVAHCRAHHPHLPQQGVGHHLVQGVVLDLGMG